MKKLKLIFSLLMLVGFITTTWAQDAVNEKPVLTADQQQAVDEVVSMNPKLSAEEIEQLKIAVLGAPAKAEELQDPKMETQPEVIAAPWNAEPIEEREAVNPKAVEQTSTTQIQAGTQPEGAKSENATNYRSLKGPSTQPQPATTKKGVNYRSIKGPGTQPESKPDGK